MSHNRTDRILGKFTRKHGPWRLIWSEPHPVRAAALARERAIKAMKSARWIREHILREDPLRPAINESAGSRVAQW